MRLANQSSSPDEPRDRQPWPSPLFEIYLAGATLSLWPSGRAAETAGLEERARAFVYMPLFGIALGVALALFDHGLARVFAPAPRSVLTIGLALLAERGLLIVGVARTVLECVPGAGPATPRRRAAGWLVAALVVLLEVVCLAATSRPAARARAIVMALMLSRWAIVPIGYGLTAVDPGGLGIPYEGGIKFREFATSSVIALGLALGLYDIVALAAAVAAAIAILLLRLLFSRRLGGAAGYALAAGAALSELVVFATLAGVGI